MVLCLAPSALGHSVRWGTVCAGAPCALEHRLRRGLPRRTYQRIMPCRSQERIARHDQIAPHASLTAMQHPPTECIRRALLVLVLAAIAAVASAQTPRFAEVAEALPDGMGQLIATADFEGDGDADLFTSTGAFLNTGGFFRPGPTLSLGFLLNVRSIAIADLTGDGRIDVLVGHVSGPQLYAAPPAGGGTFLLIANAFPGATSLSELCVADVDSDGDMDVFAAQSSTATTQWRLFLNNGSGGFTAAPLRQWAAATISPSWVGAGDFDGDGLIDAIATGYPIGTVWRRNLGGGTFGPSIVLGSSLLADDGAIGDFDGDGDDDVFVVAVDGMEAIHTGSPAGLVQGASVFGGILAAPPFAADINGDQTIDLLRSIVPVSGGTHADVVLRMGSPTGLGPAVPYRTVRFGIGNPAPFRGIALLDVQGDSGRDLAFVPGREAPSLLIADGAFGYVAAPKAVPPACGPLWVPLRDVNGDGAPDLLRADIVNGQLTLTSHHNDSRGNFAVAPTPAGAISSLASGVPSWFDLDNDGDQDLWLRQLSGSHLTLTNDGTGVFSASAAIGGVHPTASVAFGDFDGDFDIDVVVGRSINHLNPFVLQPPVIHFGQATPSGMTYTPAATFGLAEVIVDFVVFDADFDLDLDLLAVTNGGIPRLYQNDGFGVFTLAPSPAVPTTTVAVGDVNNDGLPDLVLGNQTWLHNVTSWTFAATHAAPIGRISLADVDGAG